MKKIIILEGGFNEEHEVSINTSIEVQNSLKRMKYSFEIIRVDPNDFEEKIKNYDKNFIFFNALHGPYGEDGTIQKILDKNKLFYSHSKSTCSENAFNKDYTKKILSNTDIPCLKSIVIKKDKINSLDFKEIYNELGDFVIKPVKSGSSFGVKVFNSIDDIKKFFSNIEEEMKIYLNHQEIMFEKYVKGKELTVSVIEKNNSLESLAVTEIISNNLIYDYDAKYTTGHSKHEIPAKIPKQIYNQCLYYASKAHDLLDCKSVSRSDFIFDGQNLFFLEINTQPGLTKTSLVPEQLKYKNISLDNFILDIIESSCE